jgi:hypothetical protein
MMAFSPPADRDVYRPSGRVRWLTFIQGTVMGAIGALFVAGAMMLAWRVGFYLIILVPIVGGLAIGGLAYGVVGQSHCRSRVLAAMLGIFLGAMGYLGYFHLAFLSQFGWHNWSRLDVLPHYIAFRMQNDQVGEVGKDAKQANSVENWLLGGAEFLLMCGFGAGFAVTRAQKPYAEGGRTWMKSRSAECPLGLSIPIVTALRERNTAAIEQAVVPAQSNTEGYCGLAFWMCPLDRDPQRDEPMFLSVSEYGLPDSNGGRKSEAVVQLWRIEPAEVVAFARKLPALTDWLREGTANAPATVQETPPQISQIPQISGAENAIDG